MLHLIYSKCLSFQNFDFVPETIYHKIQKLKIQKLPGAHRFNVAKDRMPG